MLKIVLNTLYFLRKCVLLHVKIRNMKKTIVILTGMLLLFGSCASEFNKVYRSPDNDYKYEYAKQLFATKKFNQAIVLLEEVVQLKKGSDQAEECLFMLAMAQYNNSDYEGAAATFRKYHQSYPRGIFAEQASFFVGQSLYESTPEPRLDQSPTIGAINAYQEFLDYYPESKRRQEAQSRLFELQDKLVLKELQNATLYYNLGNYMGNNYESAVITAQNAIKSYPYSKYKEDLEMLVLRARFKEASESVEEKKQERFRTVIDEYYSFVNDYPESKMRKEADNIFKIANKFVNGN